MKRLSVMLAIFVLVGALIYSAPSNSHAADKSQVIKLNSASDDFKITIGGEEYKVGYDIKATATVTPEENALFSRIVIDLSKARFYKPASMPELLVRIYPMYVYDGSDIKVRAMLHGKDGSTTLLMNLNAYKVRNYTGINGGKFDLTGAWSTIHADIDPHRSTPKKYAFDESMEVGEVFTDDVPFICDELIWVVVFTEPQSDVSHIYGNHREKLDGFSLILNDSMAAMENSEKGLWKDEEIEFTAPYMPSVGGGKSIDLKFYGTIDSLFTTKSHESMKAFCSVLAADENKRTVNYLKNLGFRDVKKIVAGSNNIFDYNNATYYIGHRRMTDGRELVFIYLAGTDGNLQWLSNFAPYTMNDDLNGNAHNGFWRAEQKVGEGIISYLSKRRIDPNKVFFSIGAYSRGSGLGNLLSGEDTLAGVKLSDSNCLAYTFATPNTLSREPMYDKPWIVNVVDGADPVIGVPANWYKYGTTYGYSHDAFRMEQFYGVNQINEPFYYGPHIADNYIANVFTREPALQWSTFEHRWTSVHCPTDISVVKNGEIVASVTDNIAESREKVLIMSDEDGRKTIITEDDSYQIIAKATGKGDMDVATNLIDTADGYSDLQPLQNYKIAKGEVYEINSSTGHAEKMSSYVSPKPKASDDRRGHLSSLFPTTKILIIDIVILIISIVVIVMLLRNLIKNLRAYKSRRK